MIRRDRGWTVCRFGSAAQAGREGRAAGGRRATGAARPATHDGASSVGVTMRSSASTTFGSKPVPASSCSSAERALGRPRRAVDAVGDQRVVDVAGGEDARLDRQVAALQAARVAGAVEPLVVVGDEPADGLGEAAELVEQARGRPRGGGGSRRTPRRSSGPGFWRISSGTLSLPMSCSSPPTARWRRSDGRQLELLGDARGEQGDAAGVLLGRRVPVGEPHEQRRGRGCRGRPPRRRPARSP